MGGTPFAYLGHTNAQLIVPIMVEDKIYYALDLTGDGVQDWSDLMHLDDLALNFFNTPNGALFSDVNRTWSVDDYFQALLPTFGATPVGGNHSFPGTSWSIDTQGAKTDPNSNPAYDDLLAIWDAFNGTTQATGTVGVPNNWHLDYWISATPDSSFLGNYFIMSNTGIQGSDSTGSGFALVLQVL
jgi:hypothetical protein